MGKLLGAFVWLKANLTQPGTMASIAAVCAMIGVKVDPGIIQDLINVATIFFGLLGFFFQEQKPLTKV
jgi:uncharacterized membrane protein